MLTLSTGKNIKNSGNFGYNRTLGQKFQKKEGERRNNQINQNKKFRKKIKKSRRSISS